MNASVVLAALLIAAVLAFAVAARAHGSRRIVLAVLHVAALALLWFTLFPPPVATTAGSLAVITPGAAAGAGNVEAAAVVALPGASAAAGVERVPDLATALRRHPETRHLRIVGDGLPARDRAAAQGLAVDYEAPAEPRGIVELDTPPQVRTGGAWSVAGRVQGVDGGRVELRDPSGALVDGSTVAQDGRFAFTAYAKGAGRHRFELRLLDANGAAVDTAAVPLAVEAGETLRVRVVAGGPDPELKYLRRWALDAGVTLGSRIALSTDLALRGGDAPLDAAGLRDIDLLVVDERAWAALPASEKAAVTAAVDAGLGLLLRITGPLAPAVASDWAAFGYTVSEADVPQAVNLGGEAPALTRRPVTVDADGAATLAADAGGTAFALWRPRGLGRVGAWWLVDSYRLALAGDAARHAALWSRTTAMLARPRGAPRMTLPAYAWAGERVAICQVPDGATIQDPQGHGAPLVVDATQPGRCAAAWPAQAGWHRVVAGPAAQWFHARERADAPALSRHESIAATRMLVGGAAPNASADAPRARWPFFLAWLVAASLAWWLEKRRA